MALVGFSPIARNDLGRVFLFNSGVFKRNALGQYASCVSVDALAQDRGDVTKIECPSRFKYGEYEEVGSIPGELSRMTTTLSGHMSRTDISTFYKLFKDNCKFDLHLHFGLCQKPNDFTQFDKALIFENVEVTAFSTDPLVALQSGDRGVINESIDISIGAYYEIVNLAYSQRGSATTTEGTIVATAVCDLASCGSDCDNDSDGCQRMFAASDDGTLYFSNDGGSTWDSIAIAGVDPDDEGVGVAPTPTAIVDLVCWGTDVVLLDGENTLWTIDRDGLFAGTATVFGQATTALPVNALALSTSQNQTGVIVGTGGNIAIFNNLGVDSELVDAGFTTTANLAAAHVGMDGTIVAGGVGGVVVYSNDGVTWYTATVPAAVDISSVLVKNRSNWLVGNANGDLYATDDAGLTWGTVSYPGSASNTGPINDMALSTNHVLLMVTGTDLFRSLDGGASWIREPNSKRAFVTNAGLFAVTGCSYDPNFALIGGVDDADNGMIITGTAVQA